MTDFNASWDYLFPYWTGNDAPWLELAPLGLEPHSIQNRRLVAQPRRKHNAVIVLGGKLFGQLWQVLRRGVVI